MSGKPGDAGRTGIESLPENATEPEGEPRGTQEPGRAHKPREDSADVPPAGPHAEPGLTNDAATPGAGTLTPEGRHDDVDSTSG